MISGNTSVTFLGSEVTLEPDSARFSGNPGKYRADGCNYLIDQSDGRAGLKGQWQVGAALSAMS